ncbi:hypothetical protein M23134_01217 [Microscilla marina ATCC 23134]|uniref:Uncharacterized protein n=1 Tax=Microscilla marina ATCC 23134 TaxID=313606 RepID=A1ZFW9_MICM2|nr:hypothetical protein M23134_01217 [Microscilla marina ATCC 23134]
MEFFQGLLKPPDFWHKDQKKTVWLPTKQFSLDSELKKLWKIVILKYFQ